MFYYLNGTLTVLETGMAVIDCGGVGYMCNISARTEQKLATELGKPAKLMTYLSVREDAMELFGFYDKEELSMFKLLISVSGVGPKAAISILSLMTPEKLSLAIATEDAKAISKAPGVGAKTAGRIILDLKDKVAKAFPVMESADDTPAAAAPSAAGTSKMSDAQAALLSLGYSRQEIAAALSKVDTSASLEDIIRLALNVLLRQ